jgi:phosphoserine phosphatase RsbU/P
MVMDKLPGHAFSILIIDDDEISILFLEEMIRREGYRVLTAPTFSEGFLLAESRKPDLILLDVNLPDGQGPDLCKKLKTNPATAEVPVLFLSSDTTIERKIECFDAGGLDYITKPYEPREVIARLRTHLRLQEAQKMIVELAASKTNDFMRAQEALLPPTPSEIPEAKFSVYYRQLSGAGGDFYEIIKLEDNLFDYIAVDVCGHDVGSSMVTAALKTLFAQNCSILHSPAEILSIINKTVPAVLQGHQFIAISWVRLNRLSQKALIVNAGQPPIIMISSTGEVNRIDSTGDIIGMFDSVAFETIEKSVKPGDRFILYSDGLVEVKSKTPADREAGVQKLLSLCQALPRRSVAFLVEELKNAMFETMEPEDDIVVVGVEV